MTLVGSSAYLVTRVPNPRVQGQEAQILQVRSCMVSGNWNVIVSGATSTFALSFHSIPKYSFYLLMTQNYILDVDLVCIMYS